MTSPYETQLVERNGIATLSTVVNMKGVDILGFYSGGARGIDFTALNGGDFDPFYEKLGTPPVVVFDWKRVRLVDSYGTGALASLHQTANSQRGTVIVCNLRGQPAEVFHLLRLDKIFLNPAQSLDEGIAAAEAHLELRS